MKKGSRTKKVSASFFDGKWGKTTAGTEAKNVMAKTGKIE